ncbi:hypothetical protein MoryE10_31640 [Methylogaea oryzae]|uniref:Uncharacterized protein n=2 Tax=Methylogaea oryzae TaxID=1295382 RepID=A0A8D4VR71_9GAMM|nr:hypothetical protein MoryE10_31640 [Methylogaea oryzae]
MQKNRFPIQKAKNHPMKMLLPIFLLLPALAFGAGSLCESGEQILFSCGVGKGGKQVSLCGSRRLEKNLGYLQYRFGRPGKIELAFPAAREGSLEQFRYAHYFRFQVDRTAVSFANGGFRYSLFSSYDGEEKPAVQEEGVTVAQQGEPDKESSLVCRKPVVSRLSQLEAVLPCDKDSDIAACGD